MKFVLFFTATVFLGECSRLSNAQHLRAEDKDPETNEHSQDERALNFWSAIGDWFTGCPDGDAGDDCSIGCPCRGSNSCEAWTHVCRPPGKEGDGCHLTRPCGEGLHCEAGRHICRKPGIHGEGCHLTRPCASGYWCVDAISAHNYQQCLPDCINFDAATVAKLKSDGPYEPSSWPGFDQKWAGGVVPFQADCALENHELALFTRAMNHIEEKTDITFVRYDSSKHSNYIILADYDSYTASSWVGRMKVSGWQRVNLDTIWGIAGGHGLGSAIHELLHALGWEHTQSRPDRDSYVTIKYENIEEGNDYNFDKSYSNVYNTVQKNRGYDYNSIMHYDKCAFSKNGENTIVTLDSSKQNIIGQRGGLSTQDVSEIQAYYFPPPPVLPIFSFSFPSFNWKNRRNLREHFEQDASLVDRISGTTVQTRASENKVLSETTTLCRKQTFSLSLFVTDHVHLVASPIKRADGNSSLGPEECNTMVIFHDDYEATDNNHKGIYFASSMKEAESNENNLFPLGNYTFEELYTAFDKAHGREGEYDVVENNCGKLVIQIGHSLGMNLTEEMLDYISARLTLYGGNLLSGAEETNPNLADIEDFEIWRRLVSEFTQNVLEEEEARHGT